MLWISPGLSHLRRNTTGELHTVYGAHKCRIRYRITDDSVPSHGRNCLFLCCRLLSQSGASSYKQRIRTSQKIPFFPLIVEGSHQCFLFPLFMFFPPLFRVKPLHYISWLIGHEGTGSILSVLRKKWVCLFVFLIRGHSKTQLKGLQFAGYTWAFSSSERCPECRSPIFNIYTLCQPTPPSDSYVLISVCGCTRAFSASCC